MNTINPSDYFKHKADVSNLKKAITDQQAEIENLRRRLTETQAHVNDTNTKLAIEEREISRPGALSKVTLSKEQFNNHKRAVAEMETEVTVLNEAISTRNRDLTRLKNDLGNKSREFKHLRQRTTEALADQVAKQIFELAGEPLKNLIHAMVASEAKHYGNSNSAQDLFLTKLGRRFRDSLTQDHAEGGVKTPDWLPSVQEANQHVEGQLHQIYLAEQAE